MPELKFARLPDRTLVKLSFKAPPDLVRTLEEYCRIYRAAYQQPEETVEELIPFMLAAFMQADPQFKKARKEGLAMGETPVSEPVVTSRRRRSGRSGPAPAAAPDPNLHH